MPYTPEVGISEYRLKEIAIIMYDQWLLELFGSCNPYHTYIVTLLVLIVTGYRS